MVKIAMIKSLGNDTLFWIDVTSPTEEELDSLAQRFKLHTTSLKACLEPMHLPKYESVEDTRFLILRHADDENSKKGDADTVRELTRKVAVFILPRGVITVHRAPQSFINDLFDTWKVRGLASEAQLSHVINGLLKRVFRSYERPMQIAEEVFEGFELHILNRTMSAHTIEDLYFLKRKTSVFKKMLRANLEAVSQIEDPLLRKSPYFRDVREEGERQYFHADEVVEDVNHLMQTQLAIGSFRTNEVMRVLTLFSVFFLPLTFVVGVYGMNFQFMPELQWKWGYPTVMGSLAIVTVVIWIWFRKKGWMGAGTSRA